MTPCFYVGGSSVKLAYGIPLFQVYSPTSPETKFVLIHAPFNVLLRVGESLHLKMPMAVSGVSFGM